MTGVRRRKKRAMFQAPERNAKHSKIEGVHVTLFYLCLRFQCSYVLWNILLSASIGQRWSLTCSHAGKVFSHKPPTNRGHLQIFAMARGNQRDKAREANQKKMAEQVSRPRNIAAIKPLKSSHPNDHRFVTEEGELYDWS